MDQRECSGFLSARVLAYLGGFPTQSRRYRGRAVRAWFSWADEAEAGSFGGTAAPLDHSGQNPEAPAPVPDPLVPENREADPPEGATAEKVDEATAGDRGAGETAEAVDLGERAVDEDDPEDTDLPDADAESRG